MRCDVLFVYDSFCVCLCLYMTYIQFRNYAEDKDSSVISFRIFNSAPQDLYPAISLCFDSDNESILDKAKTRALNVTHRHIAHTLYTQMLKGQTHMNDKMSKFKFDDLTIRLDNYIQKITTYDKAYETIYRYPAPNKRASPLQISITYPCIL